MAEVAGRNRHLRLGGLDDGKCETESLDDYATGVKESVVSEARQSLRMCR